jgi:hypothetical protein
LTKKAQINNVDGEEEGEGVICQEVIMSKNQVDRRRGGRRQSDIFIRNLSDELDIIIDILDGKLDATAREILEVRSLQFQLGRRKDDRETEAEIMRKLERVSKALLDLVQSRR